MRFLWLLGLAACGSVNSTVDASQSHTVSVTIGGDGGGTVSSSPAGINCPTDCSASFTATVQLTATADASSNFLGWSGACSGTGACSIAATADAAVTAMFAAKPMLTVEKVGGGTGTVTSMPAGIACGATCSAAFDGGTMVTLTATPDPGFTFKAWSGGGCGNVSPCQVPLSAATTVKALFSPPTLYLVDDGNDSLYSITNLAAPNLTLVGAIGQPFEFGDCAYDSTNHKLYVVDGRSAVTQPANPPDSLWTVDLITGVATLVGKHGINDMFALGYDPQNDTLYGVGLAGAGYALYSLNASTGAATMIGATGYTNGLAWDSKRNQMVAVTSGGSFNTINLATGAQTAIPGAGTVLGNNNGITYDAPDDLFWMATYTANTGVEKFNPNTSYSGTTLATSGMHTCIAYIP